MNNENEVIDENSESVQVHEAAAEQAVEEVQESTEFSTALTPKPKKIKKHIEAKNLVEEAKSIVQASESEVQDCRLLLEEDLRDYEDAKQVLKINSFDESKALLSELGYVLTSNENEEEGTVFEAKEDVKPIVLKDVRSGRFTGLLFSFIGGLMAFLGLMYWATEKLNITLDISKIPSDETMQKLFGIFGTQIGHPDDAAIGALSVGSVVVVVMLLIYVIRVWLKGNSNLRFATEQMKETQKYITYKTNCKVEMERVDAHIQEALKVLKDYEIVLVEQNGKLKRVLHFEGQHANTNEYHSKSVEEMKQTQSLVENIGRFITTPMSEEGKLSGKSTLFLHSAKESMEKILERFV